ncbi:DUF397 domain-containing protein [Streptomyces sp. DH24]|uniref:DUF397 domain-containing protein n=1 Tax=Streptomyces sp. DH24 TaxID=3040123 RepID=UPI002441A1E7|nr:DUF397 domain-containing protein [Streptomyces sp. DH24]MDG9720920.1 DUF397 domain-containing protein [Streptomyces sp. DH24]
MKPNRNIDLSSVRWRKSSYSNGTGGECVEVGHNLPGVIPVRDSKRPEGPALVFPTPAWARFVASLRSGASASSS